MHEAVADFVSQQVQLHGVGHVDVLDIGGRKVSTSRFYTGPHPVDLFPLAKRYHVLDLLPAADVDIAADATQPAIVSLVLKRKYDVVVCTEVLEHVADWFGVLRSAHIALKPGGLLILTCAGPGRPPHAGFHENLDKPKDEFYANVSHLEVRQALLVLGFKDVLTYQIGLDTQATAVK